MAKARKLIDSPPPLAVWRKGKPNAPGVQASGVCVEIACWVVVSTLYPAEAWAIELADRGLIPILPRVLERQPATPRRPARSVPTLAWPGYVLVGVPHGLPWQMAEHDARGNAQVLRVVGDRDRPATLCRDLMAELLSRMSARDVIDDTLDAAPPRMPAGTQVRVSAGPWSGWVGMLAEGSGAERVGVLMTLFGRPTRVDMPLTAVAPVS